MFGIENDFAKIQGGSFIMGSPASEEGRYDDETEHEVTVSDFYLGKTQVTQKQWREIMGSNPSHFKNCDECPIENVSWNDAQVFIVTLKEKTGLKFRLPTEAEWEYAARGGHASIRLSNLKSTATNMYTGSNNLDEVGWYNKNSNSKTHPVAAKKPNELGLYDMSGNIWEWCQDWYGRKYYDECKKKGTVDNPTGSQSGSDRVLRGGSWYGGARNCRSAYRSLAGPGYCNDGIGFRLVFVP